MADCDIGNGRLAGEFDGGGDDVAIGDSNAIAVRTDSRGQRNDGAVRESAEDFLRLLLHLLFFGADEGNDVGQ